MELEASGAYNFAVAPILWKNLCTPDSLQFRTHFQHAFFAVLNSSQAPLFIAQHRGPSTCIHTCRHTPRSEVTLTCKSVKIRRIKIFLQYNLYRHGIETTIFHVALVSHTEGKT